MGSNTDCCIGMGKFLAFLSLIAFLLLVAAMANPYWLEKEFTMPAGGPLFVTVESNIGILWACTDKVVPSVLDEYECESLADIDTDLVADWQWVAAGMGCGALVLTFLALILSGCIGCRAGRNTCLRVTTIICYFVACGLFIAVLVLFHEKKELTVMDQPPLKLKMEYDLNWGYYVSAAATCMLFAMAVLHAFVACGTNKVNAVV